MAVNYLINFLEHLIYTSQTTRIFRLLQLSAAILRNWLIHWGLPGWQRVFEAAIILLVVFMPVLNSWGLLLPLLFLLWGCREARPNPIAKELTVFWLALVISA